MDFSNDNRLPREPGREPPVPGHVGLRGLVAMAMGRRRKPPGAAGGAGSADDLGEA